MNSTSTPGVSSDFNTVALYSNLVQCFIIILAGYGMLKSKFVSISETQGLKFVLLYLLLPAAIIESLLKVEWNSVDWKFLACVFFTKVTLFVVVGGTTLLLSNDLAKCGIYGTFVTHGNDLAFGVPIVQAFYNTSHSEYVQYLFLALPISLLVINPIALVCLELPRHIGAASPVRLVTNVTKGVLINPVVMATLVGLLASVSLGRAGVPYLVSNLIESLAQAFIPIALFTLGSALVTSSDSSTKTFLKVTPVMLMLCKSLLFPLILWGLTSLIGDSSGDLPFFAFLYGCLPAAPSVYANAIYYNVAVEQISSGIAWNTFLCGPWLFATTQMIRARHLSNEVFLQLNNSIHYDVGFLNMILSAFVTVTWLWTHRIRQYPMYLLVMLSSYSFIYGLSACWPVLGSFGFDLGKYGLYVGTVHMACFMYLYRTCSLCMTIRYSILGIVIGVGLPLVLAVFATMISRHEHHNQHEHHLALDLLVLIVCFLLVVHLLIQQQKHVRLDFVDCIAPKPTFEHIPEPAEIVDIEDVASLVQPRISVSSQNDQPRGRVDSTNLAELDLRPADADLFDEEANLLIQSDNKEEAGDPRLCPFAHLRCDKRQRAQCTRLLLSHDKNMDEQTVDHGTLVLIVAIACVNMFVSLVNRTSSLMHGPHTGVLAELKVLEILLSHSPGILMFCLAGMSLEQLRSTIQRAWRMWRHGSPKLPLPKREELDEKTQKICQRFVHEHLARCQKDIAANVRRGLTTHRAAFTGKRLINWMLDEGIVSDRASGLRLGRRLVLAQVLAHTDMQHHLHDTHNILYRFVVVPADSHAL